METLGRIFKPRIKCFANSFYYLHGVTYWLARSLPQSHKARPFYFPLLVVPILTDDLVLLPDRQFTDMEPLS